MNERKLDALEAVIDTYQEDLFRFAFFRTGSTQEAADIVQSVFLRLYERHRDFAAIENMKSYLFRSVSNACADHHRWKQSRQTVSLAHAALHASEETGSADAAEEYKRINALLETLPDEQAEVIRMRTVSSLPFAEIAEILQVPQATAKSRFRYGIEKLRSNINRR